MQSNVRQTKTKSLSVRAASNESGGRQPMDRTTGRSSLIASSSPRMRNHAAVQLMANTSRRVRDQAERSPLSSTASAREAASKGGKTPTDTHLPVQRRHQPGIITPEGVCRKFAKAAKYHAEKFPFGQRLLETFLMSGKYGEANSWSVLVLRSHKTGEACRDFLSTFDAAAVDHGGSPQNDLAAFKIQIPGTQPQTWRDARASVVEWRDQAEADYARYSEKADEARPSPEEIYEDEKAALQGLGSASGGMLFH